MNDLFKDRLAAVDDTLLAALKVLFEERVEKEKPTISETANNVLLGEKFRAYEQAKKIVAETFEDLKIFKISKKPVSGFNKEI